MRGEDASPLLLPAAIPERGFEEEDRLCCSLGLWNDVNEVAEARRLLSLAGPLIAASLLQYSLQLISIMFVGHLGELTLSGASMATSLANVSGFSVLVCAVLSPHLLLSVASIGVGAYRIHNFWRHIVEFWSFEMVVLLSGLLPDPKLETSVLSISLNTMWMVYMIPTGLSSAVSVRVSNELGAGQPQAASLSVHVVLIIAITEGLVVALVTILVRNVWGYLYSYEEDVVRYVSTMMPVLAMSDFMDGIQCTLSGAARGCGWQKFCSFVNLGAYYVVGIPSAIMFAFFLHIGGKGLWMGIICALVVQVLVLTAAIVRTDWGQETKKARDRVMSAAVHTGHSGQVSGFSTIQH
ncbi:Mate efflux family protein [Musa troglodytarum]|uniref:Mate efflux family protein n=1 Tax=Musa troglodytarum TaxID=320322 RepID=A0A9E7L9C2_9LILI|nr:Mate efflux family protein [Musa troglodytarum]